VSLSLIFDIIVCGLLTATIVYAVALNRRLRIIQNSREELQGLLSHFSESLARAEEGIRELRKVANLVGSDLNSEIKKGSGLKDDLAYLIERGDKLANQLEDTVRKGRGNSVPHAMTLPSTQSSLSPVSPSVVSDEASVPLDDGEPKRELTAKEQKILKALTGLR